MVAGGRDSTPCCTVLALSAVIVEEVSHVLVRAPDAPVGERVELTLVVAVDGGELGVRPSFLAPKQRVPLIGGVCRSGAGDVVLSHVGFPFVVVSAL